MATILSFPSNTIQLWQYHVANPISIAEQHYSALPQHEQLHAAAFTDPLHRAQFILCRQFLREKLATFIPTKPSHIPIILSPTGKPSIRESNIQFNQSHRTNSQTGMLALFAISGDGQVGIDIDNTTLPINFDRIIEDQFTNTEQQSLLQLSPELRRASFFKMWTQKEAYLKCLEIGRAHV